MFLLRHGETEWNRLGLFQGHLDSPLTDLGRRQVRHVARHLAEKLGKRARQMAAFCSPLGRCRESAAIVGQFLDLDWQFEPRVAEFTAGAMDGARLSRIQERLSVGSVQEIYLRLDQVGGEAVRQATERVETWLQGVHQDAICLSHGAIGRLITDVYRSAPPFAGGWLLRNDTCYRLRDGLVCPFTPGSRES